jgi:hypothetical protein
MSGETGCVICFETTETHTECCRQRLCTECSDRHYSRDYRCPHCRQHSPVHSVSQRSTEAFSRGGDGLLHAVAHGASLTLQHGSFQGVFSPTRRGALTDLAALGNQDVFLQSAMRTRVNFAIGGTRNVQSQDEEVDAIAMGSTTYLPYPPPVYDAIAIGRDTVVNGRRGVAIGAGATIGSNGTNINGLVIDCGEHASGANAVTGQCLLCELRARHQLYERTFGVILWVLALLIALAVGVLLTHWLVTALLYMALFLVGFVFSYGGTEPGDVAVDVFPRRFFSLLERRRVTILE